MVNIALAMMRLAVSLIPIGRTPGFLSRAIRWLAKMGAMLVGSTRQVQRRFATEARDRQRSLDVDLKEVHILLQAIASSPEGPAAPLICRAADLIRVASRDSKITG